MQSKLAAAVIAAAVILGITSCAAPAPSAPAAQPPASAVSAPLSNAGDKSQAVVPADTPSDGDRYLASYRKLLGGNVPGAQMAYIAVPANNPGIVYASRNNTFTKGTWCFVGYGGTIAFDKTVGLYRYSYPFSTAFADCPDGVTIQLPKGYDPENGKKTTEAIDAKFKEQLDLASHMPAFSGSLAPGTPPMLGEVRSMNLVPLKSTDKTFVFWSSCNVKDKDTGKFTGHIEQLPQLTAGVTFARFTTDQPRSGHECPSGTIYITEQQPPIDNLPVLSYDDGISF